LRFDMKAYDLLIDVLALLYINIKVL
jgi:hypothetical protein